MKWVANTIDDVAVLKGGKRLPKGHSFTDIKTNHPYIRARDIKKGRIKIIDPVFLNDNTFELIKRYIVESDDICLTIVGAYVGDIGIVPNELNGANLTENAVKIKVKNNNMCNQIFLAYYLKQTNIQSLMKQMSDVAAQPKLGLYKVKNIPLMLPPLPIQQKIASVLSAYDDLIENNLRRIELLEQSARELYKEWFVRFKFPGYENVKYVDGLPEGWKRKKLGEVVDITMGQSPKSIYYNTENKGLPFHQGVTNFSSRFVIHNIFSTEGNRIADEGDILCSVRAPVGRLNIAPTKLILGRGLSGIRSKSNDQSFAFYQLQSFFFRENIIGTGAIYASVTKNQMLNIEIVEPVRDIIIEFDRIAKSIDKQIFNLTNESQLLKQARDLLLPRLMKGEIDV